MVPAARRLLPRHARRLPLAAARHARNVELLVLLFSVLLLAHGAGAAAGEDGGADEDEDDS
eukprot:363606-Chlamydomonas_euryale.AAC.4